MSVKVKPHIIKYYCGRCGKIVHKSKYKGYHDSCWKKDLKQMAKQKKVKR